MKTIYLRANRYTQEQEEKAEMLRKSLESRGFVFSDSPFGCDLVVSLGGDGSMLKAAKIALAAEKPLAGINSGRLGYLCAVSFDEAMELEDPFGELVISERAVLETTAGGQLCYALNDVVFGKACFGQTVETEVFVNGEKVMDLRGDGVIVATPTGSTAYSRNAGGPVLSPDADALCITPICSSERPLVVRGDSVIEVRLRKGEWGIFLDGVGVGGKDESLSVRRSEKKLKLLR